MNAYRYVVFPPGAAPSAEELAAFQAYAELLDNHIAYGKRRSDGGLAIACDSEPFERLRVLDPAFDELLLKWRVRGGEVVEKLSFTKDAAAWKKLQHPATPPPAESKQRHYPSPAPPDESETVAKQHDAREAEGRGRLKADRLANRGADYERLAAWLPYAFWATAALAILAVGGYLSHRLLNAEGERRFDTVERIAEDAIAEPLDREAR